MVGPVLWSCQALLVNQPSGYEGMAEFALGAQWRVFVHYIPGLLCAAYLPVAASLNRDTPERRRMLMRGNILFAGGVAGVTSLALVAFSPWILRAYGPGFEEARLVFALMLITGMVDSINNILVQTLMAAGRAWLRLVSNGVWACLLIGGSAVLVPRFGALGLALSVCGAQSIHLVLQLALALRAVRTTS
jgi:O-antigen/teichoic acid export membrane protein